MVALGLELKKNALYNLNGSTDSITYSWTCVGGNNIDVQSFNGMLICELAVNDTIKAYVATGTLRFYGGYSFMSGYYLGIS